jgi:hypothetical protein
MLFKRKILIMGGILVLICGVYLVKIYAFDKRQNNEQLKEIEQNSLHSGKTGEQSNNSEAIVNGEIKKDETNQEQAGNQKETSNQEAERLGESEKIGPQEKTEETSEEEDLDVKIIYVSPNGSGKKNGTSVKNAFSSIQQALDKVEPGEKIELASGEYFEDLVTKKHGTKEKPIMLFGQKEAVIKGSGKSERIFQIFHDYYILDGFTMDGFAGGKQKAKNYRDKLLYVHGQKEPYGQTKRGPKGLEIANMTFKNAGGECIRLRYYVTEANIHHNEITDCGFYDFVFDKGGKNGEGIYIGTSSEQWDDDKNPTDGPDKSNNNHIHHNIFNTQGNECVEVKEGSTGNIIEYNSCTGSKDKEAAGMASRGNNNIFRYNKIFGNKGCGIRFGGHKEEGEKYGIGNDAYENTIYDNDNCGIKFMQKNQGKVCGNIFEGPNGQRQKDIIGGDDGEGYEDVVGSGC